DRPVRPLAGGATMNPYIVSNWVKDANFYGRGALCEALSAPHERCVYLIGARRIGKTSLLMRMAALLRPAAVYCDLMQAAGPDQLDEARLVYLLRRRLQALAPDSEPLRASQADWDRDEPSLVRWLEQAAWRWETLGFTLTLLWDEAELLRRLPNATLMPLRAILQHAESLRLVLCASKGLAKINDHWRSDDVSPFLFGFRSMYLAGLEDDEAAELIGQRGAVQVAPEVLDAIRRHTGNHPFLIQHLCGRLYQAGQLRPPAADDLLPDAMLGGLFAIDVGYLAPSEQAILSALAGGPLAGAELQRASGVAPQLLPSFAEGLLQLGMLRQGPDGRWELGNTFFASWLRSRPAAPPDPSPVTDQASLEVIAAPAPPPVLSDRERSVLRLVAAGLSNPEIARELIIAVDTVKAHLKHISAKLEAHNRAQAVARAKELGLI
ncbi:MAG TPA: LuxR C-terminal-related transcriptional regulator, partial [Herpetosiphonaceae bacterium]